MLISQDLDQDCLTEAFPVVFLLAVEGSGSFMWLYPDFASNVNGFWWPHFQDFLIAS